MYEPSQIGVPPTEAKTLSDIGNRGIISDLLLKVNLFYESNKFFLQFFPIFAIIPLLVQFQIPERRDY